MVVAARTASRASALLCNSVRQRCLTSSLRGLEPGAVPSAQLGEDRRHMERDGPLADAQGPRDLLRGQALGEQLQDLALASSQPRRGAAECSRLRRECRATTRANSGQRRHGPAGLGGRARLAPERAWYAAPRPAAAASPGSHGRAPGDGHRACAAEWTRSAVSVPRPAGAASPEGTGAPPEGAPYVLA